MLHPYIRIRQERYILLIILLPLLEEGGILSLGEAMISGAGGGIGGKIYKWKRYELNSKTIYTWDKWSLVTTTTYKWNKYNVLSKTIYTWNRYNVNNPAYPGYTRYSTNEVEVDGKYLVYTSYTYDGEYFRRSGNYLGTVNDLQSDANGYYAHTYLGTNAISVTKLGTYVKPYYSGSLYSGCREYSWSGGGNYTKLDIPSNIISKGTANGTVSSESSTAYPDNGPSGSYWYDNKTSSVEYSKGSTSYGQVTSASSNAYPANGKSGSYWYVSTGSTASYSKGSTSYGKVTSESSTTYPNAGAQSGYWYENRTSRVEYSMGAYKDSVYSTSRNQYPDNGHDASYWYVFDGES